MIHFLADAKITFGFKRKIQFTEASNLVRDNSDVDDLNVLILKIRDEFSDSMKCVTRLAFRFLAAIQINSN